MNIEKKIISECSDLECDKKFYIIGDNGIQECKCYEKLIKYSRYEKAKIPELYWEFTADIIVEKFNKKILEDYKFFSDNVHECVNNKVDFFFYGTVGTGKTTIAILMLKDVLDAGYSGIFLNGFELINYLYSDKKSELDEMDFIVVDEMDKVMKKTIDDFCNVVSSYFGKKNIILLGNTDLADLRLKGYPEFFIDRLKELEIVEFKSDSLRGDFKSQFKKTKLNKVKSKL